jgi:hypothetical protein
MAEADAPLDVVRAASRMYSRIAGPSARAFASRQGMNE